MKPLIYTIIEHQSFGVNEITKAWGEQEGKECKRIEERANKFFKALEEFAKGKDNGGFLKYHGKTTLKAQNYVGVIQTKHGTLEILPKCFREEQIQTNIDQENPTDREKLKQDKKINKKEIEGFFAFENFKNQFNKNSMQEETPKTDSWGDISPKIQDFNLFHTPKQSAQNFLLFCLKSLKNSPFKSSNLASLSTAYTPLLEIFMQMFCNEVLEVCKKGIRHDYVAIEDNRVYLKGKLLFGGQIRHNLIHKERFYTSSDEYIANIPPNRLIKTALEFIKTLARSHTTIALIHRSIEFFEEIPSSQNIQADFLSCTNSKHFSYYDHLLSWCELFLQGKSFATYSGESEAYALLFPMEKLFESYVAYMFKKNNPTLYSIQAQSSAQYLIHSNQSKTFQLKPDLLIQTKEKTIIADTKWKTLKNTSDKKRGITQADLYQLFAYAHYYKAQEVWLIYPRLYTQSSHEQITSTQEIQAITQNLKEWNEANNQYKHDLLLTTMPMQNPQHTIDVKIFFAPLAFF